MSVIDQFKNLFAKRPVESEGDSRLSLAMPDQGADAEPPETVLVARAANSVLPDMQRGAASANALDAKSSLNMDHIAVPGLGARPVAQQQRILGTLLGVSLLLLAGITVFALHQLHAKAMVGTKAEIICFIMSRFEWQAVRVMLVGRKT